MTVRYWLSNLYFFIVYSRVGVISGMPSTLEFSTDFTKLTSIVEELSDDGKTMRTRISISPEEFSPGSVVMYRTWVNGR